MNLKKKPGVYMDYSLTASRGTCLSQKAAAIVIMDLSSSEIGGKGFLSFGELEKEFLDEKHKKLRDSAEILLREGTRKVYCYFAKNKEDLGRCLLDMEEKDDIGAILLDTALESFKKDVLDHCIKATKNKKERMAFIGYDTVAEALNAAAELNSERAAVTAGRGGFKGSFDSIYLAAFLAAKKLGYSDMTKGLSLAETKTLDDLEKALTEEEMELAIDGGVTAFEKLPHAVCLVKALTTRTKNGQAIDKSLCPLVNVLRADFVLDSLREMLYGLIKSSEGRLSYDSISSQLCVLLSDMEKEGLIESFQVPKIYGLQSDKSVCVVELSFKLAVSVDTIHINTRLVI